MRFRGPRTAVCRSTREFGSSGVAPVHQAITTTPLDHTVDTGQNSNLHQRRANRRTADVWLGKGIEPNTHRTTLTTGRGHGLERRGPPSRPRTQLGGSAPRISRSCPIVAPGMGRTRRGADLGRSVRRPPRNTISISVAESPVSGQHGCSSAPPLFLRNHRRRQTAHGGRGVPPVDPPMRCSVHRLPTPPEYTLATGWPSARTPTRQKLPKILQRFNWFPQERRQNRLTVARIPGKLPGPEMESSPPPRGTIDATTPQSGQVPTPARGPRPPPGSRWDNPTVTSALLGVF